MIAGDAGRVTVAAMRLSAISALVIVMQAGVARADGPCPAWRERQTMECMRGYLRVDPGALVLVGEDRLGVGTSAALGVLRGSEGFGVAFGVRGSYDLVRRGMWGQEFTLHVGPELRLGAWTPRAFGFMLVRGGYSRRADGPRARFDFGGPQGAAHYGLGVGMWGRIDRRVLLGAEGVVDIVQFAGKAAVPTLTLALTVGAWL